MAEIPLQARPDLVCVSCHRKIDLRTEKYLVEKRLNPALKRLEGTGRHIHERCDQVDHHPGIWHRPEELKSPTTF